MQSKRIKIIYIVPSLIIGGREKILLEMVRRLDKEKFDIYLCSLKGNGPLYEKFNGECTEIKMFNVKSGIDFKLIMNLTKYFRQRRPDIVHTHNPGPLTYGAIAAFLAGIPIVVNTEHGFAYRERFRVRFSNFLLRNFADMNICVSIELREKLKKYMFNKNKNITIYNGIEIPPGDDLDQDQMREKKLTLGFHPSDLIVGNVARLVPVKNHHILLKSMKYVIDRIPHAKLLLVGDGPLRENLEDYSRLLGISDNVTFWGETEKVQSLYEVMDIFVLSSKSEGISLTILEAMAYGKPVVATDVGGNPEIVDNQKTGVLIPSGNFKKLGNVIVELLNDQKKINYFGEKGKLKAKTHFDIIKMIDDTEKLYLSLLNKF